MNLGNGCRSQCNRINFRIHLINRATKLVPDDLLDYAEGKARGLVEAELELLHILLGEKGRRAGNKLSQLDVGCAQAFEGLPQQFRGRGPIAPNPVYPGAAKHRQGLTDPERAFDSIRYSTHRALQT